METTNIPWFVIDNKLTALGKSQAWLAVQLRTGTNTITNWKKRGGAPLARVREIADALQCSADDLLSLVTQPTHALITDDDSNKRQYPGMITDLPHIVGGMIGSNNTEPGPEGTGPYPLISWVQAGAWERIVDNFAPGDAEQWIEAPVKVSKSSYWLRVCGESMYDPTGKRSFKDGDLVLVEPHAYAENGSLVVVRLDDESEATFKQLIIEGGRKFLKALNPNWPNRIFEVNGNATICGVVKAKTEVF
ncbi:LexA family protein [Paraburkholderia caledonica]|uniref:SOS-response transcriptional repressor LexA n=1 Tax=Paraburkholderia caledonica TaxID=134536 RepID=A0AB73IS21_9BURK|nr:SOS-response transcriptional repressor LexA [Paraburkholderia caledonica]